MKILHFGAAGNLGVHVLTALIAAGHDVTCLVRSESRFRALGFDGVRVIEGDASIPASVDSAFSADVFDAAISTAGCVDNDAHSIDEAATTPFCCIFDNIATAAEERLPPPQRAVFIGGISALDVPGVTPPVALQALVGRRAPQYSAHSINHDRLLRSSLDWTLLCPGYMVEAAPAILPLRLTREALPAFAPDAFSRWQLVGALKVPFVLLPFARRKREWTVPYQSVASALVEHLSAATAQTARRVRG